jgi:hypothetical protein
MFTLAPSQRIPPIITTGTWAQTSCDIVYSGG